jgi:hypothetical protein
MFFLREPARGATEKEEVPATDDKLPAWRRYLTLLRFRRYVLLILGYIAQAFTMGGFSLWAPSFLFRVHHMKLAAAGQFFSSAVAGMGLLATLVGGFVATRWQRRTGTGYAWALAISSLFAAPLAFAAFMLPDFALAKVAMVAAMFFLFLPTGPLNTLTLETVPVNMRASSVAAQIFMIHMFGDMWSPKIVGWLSDRWDGNLQRAVLVTLPVGLVVSAFFWCWLLRETKRAVSAPPKPVVRTASVG